MGVVAPYRGIRATLPLWVAASVALAILAALFVWFSTSLNSASDELFARMQAVPPDHMPDITRLAPVKPPPPPPPPEPAAIDHLCALLEPEVQQGLVTVICNPPDPLIRRIRTAACSRPAAPPSTRALCRC